MKHIDIKRLANQYLKLADLDKWGFGDPKEPYWTFKFHTNHEFDERGICNYLTYQISLNENEVEKLNRATIQELLAHETAHAIVGIIGEGHSKTWKFALDKITSMANATFASRSLRKVA